MSFGISTWSHLDVITFLLRKANPLCGQLSFRGQVADDRERPGVVERRIFFVANIPAVAKIRMITNDPGVEEVRILFVANLPSVTEMLMNENVPGVNELWFDFHQSTPGVRLAAIFRTFYSSATKHSIERKIGRKEEPHPVLFDHQHHDHEWKVGQVEDVRLVHTRAVRDHIVHNRASTGCCSKNLGRCLIPWWRGKYCAASKIWPVYMVERLYYE
ncbi:uncharacterized protein LOC128092352 isoform X2 [Culex pipiens pallens]|uniref:uncharacterized protein LOC128092352 isoform X2 n=1 Tax=Culex pipiens pallens TaxID=42434 RepID=UPI0022AA7BB6|nr:uncharacterized protein LOC128092352 isoform X2 [Culex pipiens pallens]